MDAFVESWSLDRITDETYREKFTTVPRIIEDWMAEHGGLEGKDILEFGCGEGTTALAIALQHHRARVVGIYIMPDPERCLPLAKDQLGLDELPSNFSLHRVSAGKMHNSSDRLDLIYAWSVFEHVD